MMYKNQEGYADPTRGRRWPISAGRKGAAGLYAAGVYLLALPGQCREQYAQRPEILRLRAVPARAAHCHASAVSAIHGNKGNAADPRDGIAHGFDLADAL